MKRQSRRYRPLLVLAAVLPVVAALAACSSSGHGTVGQSPAATVHVDPAQHVVDATLPEPDEAYAPFLSWTDRSTLAVTTFGSSSPGCFPRVIEDTVDPDGAYRVLIDLDGEDGRDCTDDWTAQEQNLPVPSDVTAAAIIRLQLEGEPATAYEYPMGGSRPG